MMRKREAFAEQRIAATKDFYATLSPEQQKIFDAEHAKMERHRWEKMEHMRHGDRKGPPRDGKPAPDAPPAK
jgi:Spy/CpxP family protein refolding chaperone